MYYNAGVAIVNSKVVGLVPGLEAWSSGISSAWESIGCEICIIRQRVSGCSILEKNNLRIFWKLKYFLTFFYSVMQVRSRYICVHYWLISLWNLSSWLSLFFLPTVHTGREHFVRNMWSTHLPGIFVRKVITGTVLTTKNAKKLI
jgi:hypothetical protein